MKHARLATVSSLILSCAALVAACGGDDAPAEPADDDAANDTTTSSGAGGGGGQPGTGGGPTDPPPERATISGDATWTVHFDATAQAAGMTDCTYTRHYQGFEDRTAPWVCPSCEVIFRASVEMSAGKVECFDQFSEDEPAEEEWIGYGGGVWYRGFGLTTDQGTAEVDDAGVTMSNSVPTVDVPAGGTMAFEVAGSFTFGKEQGDALEGFVPAETYACGWPKANPPPYSGDYTIVEGATLPDGVFLDACGEPVRLHDFAGAYLLIDMAARDCPPCQMMASEEEAWVAGMKSQGIDVQIITLLAPSLADPLGETTQSMLTNWIGKYDLTSAVLADRAWGLAMFIPVYGDMVGYPSWVLVGKNLEVMQMGSGWGGFSEIEDAIVADSN